MYNEFREAAKLSAIALFNIKDFNMIRLTVQYRMAPAIVKWVNEFFYENKLVNHASVEVDNAYRRIGRQISRKVYGIEGPRGDGSEYWNINVQLGMSRHLRTNTSLVNYANSDAAVDLAFHFLTAGILAKHIGILTYYADQEMIHIKLLSHTNQEAGYLFEVGEIDNSTVDAYQGGDIRVGILDIVWADLEAEVEYKGKVEAEEDEDEDEDDDV